MFSSVLHLWETALIIQNPQYPMRLCGNEVDAGLVVIEWDVLPRDLLPAVLLLWCDHMTHRVISSILHSINQVLVVRLTHLLLPENHPVEEELHVLVCIIDAKLLEAVEGQILSEHTHNR